MNEYTIKQVNIFGKYTVCKWQAESPEKAVAEFLELNPAYKNRGAIIAE